MVIIPAIDIKGGRCVRLTQGKMDAETVYSDNPSEMAKKWASLGAELIHLVDLDAAIEGTTVNYSTIRSITEAIKTPVQIGGGIRSLEAAEKYLDIKTVKRVIIGTAATEDEGFVKTLCDKYPGRVAVGIDAKDGMVAVKGWVEVTGIKAFDMAMKLKSLGVTALIYTDISRDGMLTGPNFEANERLANSIGIDVIASGGVSKLDDIKRLKETGVAGVIVGKAIYTGDVDLAEALKV